MDEEAAGGLYIHEPYLDTIPELFNRECLIKKDISFFVPKF
jgi:hypothetical protein